MVQVQLQGLSPQFHMYFRPFVGAPKLHVWAIVGAHLQNEEDVYSLEVQNKRVYPENGWKTIRGFLFGAVKAHFQMAR